MGNINIDFIGAIGSLIGCVVWFVRLESRIKTAEKATNTLEKEVETLIVKHDALDNKILQEISMIRESIVRLETIFSMLEHVDNGNVIKKKERNK